MRETPFTRLRSGFWSRIDAAESIALVSHIDPDGDAVGSTLALYHILRAYGKDVNVVTRHAVPKFLRFLPGAEKFTPVRAASGIPRPPDLVIVLDCSDPVRVGDLVAVIEAARDVIVVDHHRDEERIPGFHVIDETASATAEILFDLCSGKLSRMPESAALALYVGISTDTGSFRYGNTSARSFRIASELIKAGRLDVPLIGKYCFARETLSRLRIRGEIYRKVVIEDNLIYGVIRPAELEKRGWDIQEAEGVIDDLALCPEVEYAAVLWELAPDYIRVQLRSVHDESVLEPARALGGGGHRKASGARIRGASLEEVLERLKRELRGVRPQRVRA
ncbi:MAG: bifunctional oligoribonuclease/PAP phosphatase NrnA [Candidatus Hydrogenedentota bacterium]|nr:MAG: bifunctional oligoribonuclease/PAP phosphatase NrnA [Candidatus Hydrogenedentota bacterium]